MKEAGIKHNGDLNLETAVAVLLSFKRAARHIKIHLGKDF